MVSALGYALAKNQLVSGFGRRHYLSHGRGIARRAAGHAVRAVGNALVNKLSNLISGTGRHRHRRVHHHAGSYKVTGTGYHHRVHHHRKPRLNLLSSLLGHGYRRRRVSTRRVGRPRTRVRHHTMGGYRPRLRAPRRTLLGHGRRYRRHRILI